MRSCGRSTRLPSPMNFFDAIPTFSAITVAWRARAGTDRLILPGPKSLPGAGGYDFNRKVDPARHDAVLWTPQALPSVVTLTNIPDGLADPKLGLASRSLQSILAADGEDQIVELRGARMRLHRQGNVREPVTILLPLDRLFDIRAAAALRVWRGMTGRKPGPDLGVLTVDRRNRLILALRALDGRLEGASYPEIAAALFDTAPISKRDWISHELRDQTGRLVRLGFSMMRGGYRRLLLHPYRRRV